MTAPCGGHSVTTKKDGRRMSTLAALTRNGALKPNDDEGEGQNLFSRSAPSHSRSYRASMADWLWLVMVVCMNAIACGGSSASPTPTPASTAPPAPTTFTLAGSVSDPLNKGIGGATVRIADGPNANKTATTDSAGAYSIPALTVSGFTVIAAAAGYASLSKSVTLTQNSQLGFSLPSLLQGDWSGTTGQGRSITFSVDNAPTLSKIKVDVNTQGFVGSNCPAGLSTTITFPSGQTISNLRFTVTGPVTIAGTFDTTYRVATGTLTMNSNVSPSCPSITASTTWSATKS
jgi:hypothetical protein